MKKIFTFFTKNSGFTLLELLVVISVMGILTSGGIASFVSYNNKQILDQAALDLKTGIDLAKFDAVSKVKPTASPCDVAPLDRYKISISSTSTDLYDITAGCMVGTNLSWTSTLASKPLPTSVTITQSCSPEFSVLSGINAPCSVVLQDGSAYKTICIDGGGNTSISDGQVACGQAYIPVTPTPTSPPITLIPTPTPLPNPPNISQQWDTNVKDTTAVLNSTVDPNGGKTSITYRYSGVLNSYCNPQLTDTLAGPNGITSLSSPNSTNLTNLTGNTSYSYCATADNTPAGGGITNGVGNNNLSSNFLTLPSAPVITSVGSPTQTSLTVNWTPPTGGTATYSLYYCDNTAVPGCSPTTLVSNSISGVVTAYTHNLGAGNCGKSLAYQLVAVNNTGSSVPSNIMTGTTSTCPTAPIIVSQNAVQGTGGNIQFQSNVNPGGSPTTVYYKASTTNTGSCSTLSGTPVDYGSIGSGATNVSPNAISAGYSLGSTWYYCVYATNSIGTTYSSSIGTFSICAMDADGDGYGNLNGGQATCGTAGYVSDNTDCYDYNANAHPGQTAYFITNRGDGSFDYNCDGSIEYQTTSSYYCVGSLSTYSNSTSYNSSTGYSYCSTPGSYSSGVSPVTLCSSLTGMIPPCGTWATFWNGYYMIYANSCSSFLGYAVSMQQGCY